MCAGMALTTRRSLSSGGVTERFLGAKLPPAIGLGKPGGIWHDSYEAEQHLLHLGQAEEPVCWTLTGFASGYMSCVYGKEIIAIEDRCRGKGDAICRAVVRSKEKWGPEPGDAPLLLPKGGLPGCEAGATDRHAQEKRAAASVAPGRRQSDPHVPAGLVGSSPAMLRTLDLARRVAKVDSTILITGEIGVGKERLARFIHDESARTAGPFLAINCAAVPESLYRKLKQDRR